MKTKYAKFDFVYHIILYVLFHSFNVFGVHLQLKKKFCPKVVVSHINGLIIGYQNI